MILLSLKIQKCSILFFRDLGPSFGPKTQQTNHIFVPTTSPASGVCIRKLPMMAVSHRWGPTCSLFKLPETFSRDLCAEFLPFSCLLQDKVFPVFLLCTHIFGWKCCFSLQKAFKFFSAHDSFQKTALFGVSKFVASTSSRFGGEQSAMKQKMCSFSCILFFRFLVWLGEGNLLRRFARKHPSTVSCFVNIFVRM